MRKLTLFLLFTLVFMFFNNSAALASNSPHDLLNYTIRQDGKKYIALTFDDGPHYSNTPKLLDILRDNGAKATFFLLGYRVEILRDITVRIAKEGNEIGNHTYSHTRMDKASRSVIEGEITLANHVITELTGQIPKFFRPPFGNKSNELISAVKAADMAVALWDIDTRDWGNRSASAIARHVIKNAKDGSIVLMHDAYPNSVKATGIIIKELKEQGFEFITLSDLIHMDNGFTEGAVYRNSRGAIQNE